MARIEMNGMARMKANGTVRMKDLACDILDCVDATGYDYDFLVDVTGDAMKAAHESGEDAVRAFYEVLVSAYELDL